MCNDCLQKYEDQAAKSFSYRFADLDAPLT